MTKPLYWDEAGARLMATRLNLLKARAGKVQYRFIPWILDPVNNKWVVEQQRKDAGGDWMHLSFLQCDHANNLLALTKPLSVRG